MTFTSRNPRQEPWDARRRVAVAQTGLPVNSSKRRERAGGRRHARVAHNYLYGLVRADRLPRALRTGFDFKGTLRVIRHNFCRWLGSYPVENM